MDRRTVLAFALIFLILMGSQLLMQKMYPQDPAAEAADSLGIREPVTEAEIEDRPTTSPPLRESSTTSTGSEPTSASNEPADRAGDGGTDLPLSVQDAVELVAAAPAREIVVTTPLYRAHISTDGGRIVGWEMREHRSYTGAPVQLVPEEIPEHGLDAVVFRNAELDLGTALYAADLPARVEVPEGAVRSLTLTVRTAAGLAVRKIFTFDAAIYGVSVDIVVDEEGDAARHALDLLGDPLAIRFGWNQGIAPTERVQRMELPSLRSFARVGEENIYKKRDGLKKSVEKVAERIRGSIHFAGLQNRYFTIVGIVPEAAEMPVEGSIELGGDRPLMAQSWVIERPVQPSRTGETAAARLELFLGPQQAELLAVYGQDLENTMDLGWKLFRPLVEIVLGFMEFLHRFIPNYGLIIILFSVLTKLLFYPLTKSSTKSMKKMQELQPKLKAIQEKYKDDKEKLNQATMKLYKEEKVNPLAGCLPLLVQSPVFIALYQALSHTISLRGQPFVLWIDDLSQPDALATLPFALPFLGSDLNILPILMSVAMYFQSKLTPTTGGGQMAAMNAMLPVIMIFIFYNMPSGLVLYWLVNTLMQGYQSWKISKTASTDGGAQST